MQRRGRLEQAAFMLSGACSPALGPYIEVPHSFDVFVLPVAGF
jgi:hypothetical protein